MAFNEGGQSPAPYTFTARIWNLYVRWLIRSLTVWDVVVALLPPASGAAGMPPAADPIVLARDPASGLAVIRVPAARAMALPLWSPLRLQYPRYLLVSDVSPTGTS